MGGVVGREAFMSGRGAVVLWLLLVSGCATTRGVTLDTGQGTPRVYRPIETPPVELDEAEFKAAAVRLVLEWRLPVGLEAPREEGRRALLASVGDGVDEAPGRGVPPMEEEPGCQRQGRPGGCPGLLPAGFALSPMERRMRALSFALDTVWEGVGEAVGGLADPAALKAMVVSMVASSLVMLVAPEPITKLIAIGLTVSLIAYLGTGPVWNLGQGFRRLMQEAERAHGDAELEEAGHRFGRVLGDNGARVLVLVAMSALGGRSAMAARGARLPGAAQAALKLQAEGGLLLQAALEGEVESIALPAEGVLNVALAPTAVAAVAMGPGGGIQGDPEGQVHHICTNKNEVSDASGGPWTPLYERYFKQAGMDLEDQVNQVRINGHKGPHPREYHQEVLRRIDSAMKGCRSADQCRAALVEELSKIAHDLTTKGTRLRKLITKSLEE